MTSEKHSPVNGMSDAMFDEMMARTNVRAWFAQPFNPDAETTAQFALDHRQGPRASALLADAALDPMTSAVFAWRARVGPFLVNGLPAQ